MTRLLTILLAWVLSTSITLAQSAVPNSAILGGSTNGKAPTSTTGGEGSYFLDSTTGGLYGPKTTGIWPASPITILVPSGGPLVGTTLALGGASISNYTFAVTGTSFINGNMYIQSGSFLQFGSQTTGGGTQTFTDSPCTTLTTERWVGVQIQNQSGTWYIPTCQ